LVGSAASADSCSFASLGVTAQNIIQAALAPATHAAYSTAWNRLQVFCSSSGVSAELPISVKVLIQYLTSLFEAGLAGNTLLSHVSAISHFHKLAGVEDPTASFLIKKFLKGAQKLNKSSDTRLPITLPLLQRLIGALEVAVSSVSERVLIAALFLLVFHAFLRMGEVCLQAGADERRLIQRQDVEFSASNGPSSLTVTLRDFKHKSEAVQPVHLVLSPAESKEQFCVVSAVRKLLSTFPGNSGPLFQFHDGSPVPYSFAAKRLSLLVQFLGLDAHRYKPHSFRIGAATTALMSGVSEEVIQRMGRWKSSAVKGYVRIPSFASRLA
jgi:hypothetical protein